MKGVDMAIGILLIIVVAGAVLPGAFTSWYDDGNGTSPAADWPGMMGSIWELVPLFAVLALALHMYRKVE